MEIQRRVKARTGDHYLVETRLFSTPTGCPPFNFPVIPQLNVSREPSARATAYFDVTSPGWITDGMPYLGFVPAVNPMTANWLRPLRYSFSTIPVQRRDDNTFELDPRLRTEWDALERNFRSLLSAAMSLSKLSLPHPFRLWSFPRQYGYTRSHRTEKAARRQALASRDAFMPLMAELSFFAHALVHNEPHVYTKQSVMQQLAAERNVSETWISYVVNSLLDTPLTGGYIDCSSDSMTRWIPLHKSSGMPLCLYWGPTSDFVPKLIPSMLSGMHPSIEEVVYLRSQKPSKESRPFEHIPPASLSSTSSPPNRSPHTSPSPQSSHPSLFPRVQQGSKQRPGETIQAFFNRRSQENEKLEQAESMQARQRRMQLLEYAKKDLPPGRSSRTRVFYWELENGFRIRTAGGQSKYEWYWEVYGSRQRRYDSFHNEWDVCTDLDPDDGPEDLDDLSDDEPIDGYPDDDPPIIAGYTAEEYLGRLHGSTLLDALDHTPPHFDLSLRDMAYRRVGFLPRISQQSPSPATDLKLAREILGLSKVPVEVGMEDDEYTSLVDLLKCIREAKSFKDLPVTMDLLDAENRIHQSWPFSVRFRNIDGGIFLLRCPGTDRFQIGLKSATSVLELVRRRIKPVEEDIMAELVAQGSAFRTFKVHELLHGDTTDSFPSSSSNIVPPPLVKNIVRWEGDPSVPSGCRAKLGFRSQNYNFTVADFQAYVAMRDEFLSSPRGRAAVLAGGLLARLATHAVHERDVYKGTADNIVESWIIGDLLSDPQDKTVVFWDDRLTEEEVNLICGVYEVATGPVMRNGTIQTAELSWFPKPGAWKTSGLNCGYWSRDAEVWYQDRLHKIHGGNAQLLNNAKWKEIIKFSKNSRKVLDRADDFALEYMNDRLNMDRSGR